MINVPYKGKGTTVYNSNSTSRYILNKPAGDTSCTALLLLKLAVATNEAEHGKMRSLCQNGLTLNSDKITVKEIIIIKTTKIK